MRYRIDDTHKQRVADKLKCDTKDEDCICAVNVMEEIYAQYERRHGKPCVIGKPYKVDAEHETYFVLKFEKVSVVSNADVKSLLRIHNVFNVRILFKTLRVHVYVHRSCIPNKDRINPMTVFKPLPQSKRKKRMVDVEWDKKLVPNKSDQDNILAIVDDVYNVYNKIPQIMFFYEAHRKGTDDEVNDDDGEASSSSVSMAAQLVNCDRSVPTEVPENDGIVVRFSNMPDLDSSFFDYLFNTYGSILTHLSARLCVEPHAEFICCIKRTVPRVRQMDYDFNDNTISKKKKKE